jgi:hypothetical protein
MVLFFSLMVNQDMVNRGGRKDWRVEMALIQISVPARENYRVIKGF